MEDELGWVIEYGTPPHYWTGRGLEVFSPAHPDAVRFARQEDADRVRVWLLQQPDNYLGIRPNRDRDLKVVLHLWSYPNPVPVND